MNQKATAPRGDQSNIGKTDGLSCQPRLLGPLHKGLSAAPSLLTSVLITIVVWPALPGLLQFVVSLVTIAMSVILMHSASEPVAVRLLMNARPLAPREARLFRAVTSELRSVGLLDPSAQLFVSRTVGGTYARATGSHSVVLSQEFLDAVSARCLPPAQVVAAMAHVALSLQSGRNRHDLLVRFWTLPWRSMMWLGLPARRLVLFGWRVRPLVVGVALWRSFTAQTPVAAPPTQVAIGCALVVMLALSYVLPVLIRRWEAQVAAEVDRVVIDCGLGPDLADFLRGRPAGQREAVRLHALSFGTRAAA